MRGYETHETFWSDLRMYFSMFLRAFFIGALLQIVILFLAVNRIDQPVYVAGTNTEMPQSVFATYHFNWTGFITNGYADVPAILQPYADGYKKLRLDTYKKFVDWLVDGEYSRQHEKLLKMYHLSYLSYSFTILYLVLFYASAKTAKDERFIRGAQIMSLKALNKKLAAEAKKNQLSCLKVGETILPCDMEPKHILILGASGSGKGVLLNQLAAQITQRKHVQKTNDRCVFYDVKGEFLSKQFMPGDIVFNPFDTRSTGWNIFAEIEDYPDLDVISRSLFAAPDAKDSYWYNCAGDVFRAGLVWLKLNNYTSNAEIWEFYSQPLANIKAAFQTLPVAEQGALKHVDSQDSPASASIISILQERIQFFKYLIGQDGDFSFRRYIRAARDPAAPPLPNLFLLNPEQYANITRPLLTLAVDIMSREVLSLDDDSRRRIWFFLDELGTLNRMDSIIQLLTVSRSKGGALVAASQDLGRIEERYGKANLKTFFNNFNTTFTFRIREPETAEFLSKAIGEQQLIKTSLSRQMSPNSIGDRKSVNEQERTERLIMPVEFQGLPDLTAIINIANFGISKIAVPPQFYRERHPSFQKRDFGLFGTATSAAAPDKTAAQEAAPTAPPEQTGEGDNVGIKLQI